MTRKHFEAAARIVREYNGDESKGIAAGVFVALFEQFSPNFDRARFLKACGL